MGLDDCSCRCQIESGRKPLGATKDTKQDEKGYIRKYLTVLMRGFIGPKET